MDNTVFNSQQFVKVNPIDYTKEVEQAKKELPELKRQILSEKRRLNKKEFISEKDKKKLADDYEYMQSVEEVSKLCPISTYGMDRFWTLSIQDDCYVLMSNRSSLDDDIILTRFYTIEGIFKQFRSLSDIINNEKFIGKRIISKTPANIPLYGLYELNNVILVCTVNEKNRIKRVYPGVKSFQGPVDYTGESKPELNDNGRILRLVYKQRV